MASARDYLVQCSVGAMENNSFTDSVCYLRQPAGAGNCVLLFAFVPTAVGTPTISDNTAGSNNYGTPTSISSVDSQKLMMWICPNISGSTNKITISFGSSTAAFQSFYYEFCHIKSASPSDITPATAAPTGSTAPAAGSFTPAHDNCLIFQLAANCSVSGPTATAASFSPSTAQPDWELVHSQLLGATASQFTIQDKAAAINPTLTCGTSFDWCTIAVALQTDTAQGTSIPTTKPWVRRRIMNSYLSGTTSTLTVQQPDIGGGVIALSCHAYDGAAVSHAVSKITSNNNRANILGTSASHFNAGNSVDSSIWFDACVDAARPLLTVTFANVVSEVTIIMREIMNLDPGHPVGTSFTSSGNETSTNSLECGSFTPTRRNSISVAVAPLDTGTAKQTITPDTNSFDGWTSSGMGGQGFDTTEEDNMQVCYINSTLAAIDWKVNVDTTGAANGAVGNWDVSSLEFMSALPVYRKMPRDQWRRRQKMVNFLRQPDLVFTAPPSTGRLFHKASLDGIGSGGQLFANPLGA